MKILSDIIVDGTTTLNNVVYTWTIPVVQPATNPTVANFTYDSMVSNFAVITGSGNFYPSQLSTLPEWVVIELNFINESVVMKPWFYFQGNALANDILLKRGTLIKICKIGANLTILELSNAIKETGNGRLFIAQFPQISVNGVAGTSAWFYRTNQSQYANGGWSSSSTVTPSDVFAGDTTLCQGFTPPFDCRIKSARVDGYCTYPYETVFNFAVTTRQYNYLSGTTPVSKTLLFNEPVTLGNTALSHGGFKYQIPTANLDTTTVIPQGNDIRAYTCNNGNGVTITYGIVTCVFEEV